MRQSISKNLSDISIDKSTEHIIISAIQFRELSEFSELELLHDLLKEDGRDISVLLHISEPSRMLVSYYEEQIFLGRDHSLSRDINLCSKDDWWGACLSLRNACRIEDGYYPDIQGPPHWIDLDRTIDFWKSQFGVGAVSLFAPPSPENLEEYARSVKNAFSIDLEPTYHVLETRPSATTLARVRALNGLLSKLKSRGRVIPPKLHRSFANRLSVPGAPIDPGSLHKISARFDTKSLDPSKFSSPTNLQNLRKPKPSADWVEASPGDDFRASQYGAAFLPEIESATAKARKRSDQRGTGSTEDIRASHVLPPFAQSQFRSLSRSRFAPHNVMPPEDIAVPAAPFEDTTLARADTVLIVACMKNEAPYILEWIAHHRTIGVNRFLIYTNDCSDGTDALLDRLDTLGIVEHRRNENWRGKSPQQFALNQAQREPSLRSADWIIHIDVDEFIDIRCGNGTLHDALERMPDATNIAMTWRLFGANGKSTLSDALVIEEFDRAAPRFCPKPHTAWGIKTMFRNTGSYGKMSCHRPNKLDPDRRGEVRWMNGSGRDITEEVIDRGWRSSVKSVGYELIQLNHYALRSAESFLIKRQRGRALHVDRTIGLNYWIRMDWSYHRDLSIQRNLPRLKAELARILSDPEVRRLNDAGRKWHRDKAAELRADPEFADLYEKALSLNLTETERAAYALALDMES